MSNKEPVLVVLAAGMGSRYGGLKQMDPVDRWGHVILDFSVYDAIRAGFKKVVFVIKHEIEKDFVDVVGKKMEPFIEVSYVFQELSRLPEGYRLPEGRKKPFGTGHAVLCAREVVDGPFAVINADDYYGPHAFSILYQYLAGLKEDEQDRYVMVGFAIENTITEHGHVARGVCATDRRGYLTDITERTRIEKIRGEAAYTLDEGENYTTIPDGTPVSMNCWGFSGMFMDELKARFPAFLDSALDDNPLGCEYFLPEVVKQLLREQLASVKVLSSPDRWYGVTYKEDKEAVKMAMERFRETGGPDGEPLYPEYLWKKGKRQVFDGHQETIVE